MSIVWLEEHLGILLEELEKMVVERDVWASLVKLLPTRPDSGTAADNKWIDG